MLLEILLSECLQVVFLGFQQGSLRVPSRSPEGTVSPETLLAELALAGDPDSAAGVA